MHDNADGSSQTDLPSPSSKSNGFIFALLRIKPDTGVCIEIAFRMRQSEAGHVLSLPAATDRMWVTIGVNHFLSGAEQASRIVSSVTGVLVSAPVAYCRKK